MIILKLFIISLSLSRVREEGSEFIVVSRLWWFKTSSICLRIFQLIFCLHLRKFLYNTFHNPWSFPCWVREMTWEIECGFVKWHQMCRVIRNKWKKVLTLPWACAFCKSEKIFYQTLNWCTNLFPFLPQFIFRILLPVSSDVISLCICVYLPTILLHLLLQKSLMNAKICIILEKVSRCYKSNVWVLNALTLKRKT